VGGFQSPVYGGEQVGVDGIGAGHVLQPGGDGLIGVVTGPVEPPVHDALDPPAQRVEGRGETRALRSSGRKERAALNHGPFGKIDLWPTGPRLILFLPGP
jgi:hypothetical protein